MLRRYIHDSNRSTMEVFMFYGYSFVWASTLATLYGKPITLWSRYIYVCIMCVYWVLFSSKTLSFVGKSLLKSLQLHVYFKGCGWYLPIVWMTNCGRIRSFRDSNWSDPNNTNPFKFQKIFITTNVANFHIKPPNTVIFCFNWGGGGLRGVEFCFCFSLCSLSTCPS